MCDCFKSHKFIYFMIAIIIASNIILFIWNKWWRAQIEDFGGTSVEILQLKNDLSNINNQLEDYDDSVRSYVISMGLKSEDDVKKTEADVERDNKMIEKMNSNILSSVGLMENNAYAQLTSYLDFNLNKIEDTTEELKDTMMRL